MECSATAPRTLQLKRVQRWPSGFAQSPMSAHTQLYRSESVDVVAGPSPGVENGTTGGFLWLVEAHRRGRISKIRARLYLRSEEVVTAMAADRGAHRECASASWSLKKWVTRPGGTP